MAGPATAGRQNVDAVRTKGVEKKWHHETGLGWDDDCFGVGWVGRSTDTDWPVD